MFKSVDTIKGYKRQIFEKLGVANTIEAISIATNQKWI
jgi:DNA-binding NarL/FixJ family response regulator